MIQQSHSWVYIQKNCKANILSSTIYNSQDVETIQVPINRQLA